MKVLPVLFSFSLLRLLSFSLRVEHDGDKVAAAAADVDGDVPESDEGEIPAVYDQPGGGHGQAVRHLHQSRSIWSLQHLQPPHLHLGLDLPAGEVPAIATRLSRVGADYLGYLL